MPLYQVVCITTHVTDYKHIKELVRQTAVHLMNAGSQVRSIKSLGTLTLPHRMRRHKAHFDIGDYWTINVDAAPRTLQSMTSIMRRDPRIIRWTVLKLADKVEDVAAQGQKILQLATPEDPLQDLVD